MTLHAHIDMVRSYEHKCESLNNNMTIASWDVLAHNFSPFDIQHTKSPKNPTSTYALEHMSKVWKLQSLAMHADTTIQAGRPGVPAL